MSKICDKLPEFLKKIAPDTEYTLNLALEDGGAFVLRHYIWITKHVRHKVSRWPRRYLRPRSRSPVLSIVRKLSVGFCAFGYSARGCIWKKSCLRKFRKDALCFWSFWKSNLKSEKMTPEFQRKLEKTEQNKTISSFVQRLTRATWMHRIWLTKQSVWEHWLNCVTLNGFR